MDDTKVTEYLTQEEYQDREANEAELTRIANGIGVRNSGTAKALQFTRSSKVTRQEVVNAFTNAFQMIGGVDRLALWADQNPSEFYRLYGKLLPPSNADIMDGNREFIVRHVLPQPLGELVGSLLAHPDGETRAPAVLHRGIGILVSRDVEPAASGISRGLLLQDGLA